MDAHAVQVLAVRESDAYAAYEAARDAVRANSAAMQSPDPAVRGRARFEATDLGMRRREAYARWFEAHDALGALTALGLEAPARS